MKYVFGFDESPALEMEEARLLLGGKGHNLVVMRNELDLPVPPGFTVSTEAGLRFLQSGWFTELETEITAHMAMLEEAVGRRFGGPGEPLLVSVRSGAPISMPGMMDTILNLGLNDDTAHALAQTTGSDGFVSRLRDRFDQMFSDIVGVSKVPTDPWEQLWLAVQAVFRSWDSPRCRTYREHEQVGDDMCTAVTVQTMVFGNRDEDSATGVLFTRNPATGEPELFGDIMFGAQGEDVVAGTHNPEPIDVLDERLPTVGRTLRDYARLLETHYRDLCDIEFTIEHGRLWMLQVRVGKRSPQAALRIALDMANDEGFPLSRSEAVERVAELLGNPPLQSRNVMDVSESLTEGLPASPGIASGLIALTPEEAISSSEQGIGAILVRRETSPDDVHGMARSVGILTCRGGLASHAAVVARGWGIPAVVGATEVEISEGRVSIGGRIFGQGEAITIDGTNGHVFAGEVDPEAAISVEAETLIGWADDLAIDLPSEPKAAKPRPGESVERDVEDTVDGDEVIRALLIKGFSTALDIATAIDTPSESVNRILMSLNNEGSVSQIGDMYQLTDEGRSAGASIMAADRERWTVESASRALDGFLPLDARFKEIVTNWQMRSVDGEQILNDHNDKAHDGSVLDAFARLHREATDWLEDLVEGLPRLNTYLDRLQAAAQSVAEGHHEYIASPRLDSYHTVWFELHEDLIILAGRTREEEAAAGRA